MKYLRTKNLFWFIKFIFLVFVSLKAIQAKKLTSLVAKKVDCHGSPNFISHYECTLKAISRDKKLVNLWCNFTRPLENVFVTLKLYRRYSGWRPYLFDVKINYCNFIKSGSKSNNLMKIFVKVIEKYSNINHPCPFDHPIYLRDLNPSTPGLLDFGSSLFPNGAYKLEVDFHEVKQQYIGHLLFQGDIVDVDV